MATGLTLNHRLLLLIFALSLTACSGSSDPDSSSETDSPPVSDVAPVINDTEATNDFSQVTFAIEVPVYRSDELQVRLTSGDRILFADWVVETSWSASVDLPRNSNNRLVVDFLDRNGEITLGQAEIDLRIGDAPTLNVEIIASDFSTDDWDDDGDGDSNIVELTAGADPLVLQAISPVTLSLEILPTKTFRIHWQSSAGAIFYQLLENLDGVSGFSIIIDRLDHATTSFDLSVPLHLRTSARYVVQACNARGCAASAPIQVNGALVDAIGFIKASNAEGRIDTELTGLVNFDDGDLFGSSISLSRDGRTLAVGAVGEDSAATEFNGNQTDNTARESGAVYVFVREENAWQQTAYIKPSNTDAGDNFGTAVALNADGTRLVVSALNEQSAATGIDGDQGNAFSIFRGPGAVYVFGRVGAGWRQEAYLKPALAKQSLRFGDSIDISDTGDTVVVGATNDSNEATGINPEISAGASAGSGAVYIYERERESWSQQAYIKASDSNASMAFGSATALSANGNVLAVSANRDNGLGSVYIYARNNNTWQERIKLRAGNPDLLDDFGSSVALDAWGTTLAVGAIGEDSAATGIDGLSEDASASESGAVYIFTDQRGQWRQQAYIKTSNTDAGDNFGTAIDLSADGNLLSVGASGERGGDLGVNGIEVDNPLRDAGAAYVFERVNGNWRQEAYVKSSNPGIEHRFGSSISLSGDGETLAIGSLGESSLSATQMVPPQVTGVAPESGAVYLY